MRGKLSLLASLMGSFLFGSVFAQETVDSAFAQTADAQESPNGLLGQLSALEEHMGAAAGFLFSVFFYDFGLGIPLIIIVLVGGGIYYSFFFRWISLRGFKHSIDVIRGRYDNPDDPGEISHFKALTSALSATIGLGNIGGVAVAVGTGGPGAVFWMIVTALFGMSSKLASCTLAVMYRKIHPDGRVAGGPMYYLEEGLGQKGLARLGRTLAVVFALLTLGGAFGGGNMFQANQTVEILGTVFPVFTEQGAKWILGIVLAAFVGVVIIGGIKRIGNVTSRIVPFMCGLYVLTSVLIILTHIADVPGLLAEIVRQAFTPKAAFGGALGVLIIGVRRAAFSNEAGLGSAAFAHAAAKTDEPAREGMVAMIGPFIDTIIICLMTALVCMITGVYDDPEFAGKGVSMTSAAFETFIPGAGYVLAGVVMLFAYSTMISWSYYGERAWEYLFGMGSVLVYRIIFVMFVVIGSVNALTNVLNFSDAMILGMAFPNIIGGILLSPQIKATLKEYWARLQSGEMKTYK